MWSFNLVRWLKTRFRSRGKTIEKKPRFRLSFEELETRLAPAGVDFIWTGASGSNWATAGNWLGGVAPTASSTLDNFIFDNRGAGNLSPVNNISGLIVNSIQISSVNDYNITGNLITLGSPSTPGSGTIQVANNLTGPAGAPFLGGEYIGLDMQLAATSGSQQFITVGSGAVLTLGGRLSGISGSQLTKSGTGTLKLTRDNSTYVGPVNIVPDGGIININHAKALGGTVSSSVQRVTLTGATAATRFNLTFGASTTATPIAYTGTAVDATNVQTALNALASIGGVGGFVFVTQSNSAGSETFTITFGGNLAGTAQALVTASISTAPGTPSSSHLALGGLATANLVTINNNAQLQINGVGATPILNPLKLFGTGFSNDGSLFNIAGNNTWAGPIMMGSNTSFNTANGTSLTISGTISDLGSPFNVNKIGRGTLIFVSANSYRGSTTVSDGILTIENPLALGSVPAAGTSVVRDSALGTIGTLRLQFESTVAPTGPANPLFWTLQDPTLPFNAITNPYVGFVVQSVPLTLNAGGFGGNGALQNFAGNNTWTGNIILGSPAPVGANVTIQVNADPVTSVDTSLRLTGVIGDVVAPNGPFNLTKNGTGNLIVEPTNPSTGHGTSNLYRGTTTISAGTLTLRDSQGLGPQTKTALTTVANNATLALESNIGHIDSVTNTVNRLQVAAPLSMTGGGYNSVGALHNVSGINTYVSKFVVSPVQSAITPVAGGALTIGTTFYYVITALDGFGESLASNEQSFTPVAGNQTAHLSWSQVPGATGYNIYRTTVSGTYTSPRLKTTIVGGSTLTFDDAVVGGLLAGTPPTVRPVITMTGAGAAIGVEIEPSQTATKNYFTNDYSLTITGGLSDSPGAAKLLTKIGAGHLILPNANNSFLGNTNIDAGWITIQDPNALGAPNPSVQEVQPLVKVETGAALMLRPFAPGTSFTFTHNLELTGLGITHPYSEINQQGALENLAGVNTVASNILLAGPAGIGVEEVFDRSHLYMTGSVSEGVPTLNFTGNPSGGAAENIGPGAGQNPVDTGSTSGILTISAKVHSIGDDIRVYMGNWKLDPLNARLIYDASNDFVSVAPTSTNQFGADITINYTANSAIIDVIDTFDPGPGPSGTGTGWLYEGLGPQVVPYAPVAGAYSTWVTIVVNPGKTGFGVTQWTYSAQIVPSGSFGSIVKLGSQRLDMQGYGTYNGGVDIREGVVRVENNNALGMPGNNGTTVQAGAALELATTVPDQNGGLAVGTSIWNTPLTLNGTGNSTFGDAPLTVLSKDNYWHGPITLLSNVAITFEGSLANQAINTMTATSSLTGSGATVNVVTSTPGGGGLNAVQTLLFTGNITGGTFNLTYDVGAGPVTKTNIAYSSDPATLIANIISKLTSGAGNLAGKINVALASPTIDIKPNARFIVTGVVDDGLGTGIASPLIHDYTLNNTYADDPVFGGPALVPTGGTLGATSYSFNAGGRAAHIGANEGLTLTGALAPGANTYSIQIVATIDELPPPATTGYVRLVDWLTATPDDGLYIHDLGAGGFLNLYPTAASGPVGVFGPGPTSFNLIITRDGPSGIMQGFVNGVLQFSQPDLTNGVISPTGVLNFFLDDITGVPNEISSGSVDRILVYSRELTLAEIAIVSPNATTVGTLPNTVAISRSPSDLYVTGGGELVLQGGNTYRGTTFVNQGIVTLLNGQALGDIAQAGEQKVALTGAVAGSTQFKLTLNGATTGAITYNGTAADAVNIKNALSGAFFNSAGFPGASATVTQTNPGVFLITLGGSLAGNTSPVFSANVTSGIGIASAGIEGGTIVADQAQLQLQGGISVSGEPLTIQGSGYNVESAVQTFTVGTTALVPTGTYSLSFNGADTGPLPFNTTAGQLQTALQNLPTVKNQGGQIIVNTSTVFAGSNEEQRVTFLGYANGDRYQLYFDPAGGPQQLGYNLTAPLVYDGLNPFNNKNAIVAALGNLQTVTNVGGSISGIASAGGVTANSFADFLFTGGLADQPVGLISAFTVSGAGANPVVTHFVNGTFGSKTFTVEFQGSFAGLPQANLILGATGTTGSTTLSTPVTTIIGGSANATPLQWLQQGPGPIVDATVFNGGGGNPQTTTGRITGVSVQQGFANDIYISTAGGGIWRTVDGGAHWTPVFDASANNSVMFTGAVTIAQTNNSTVYFAGGEGNNSGDSYYGSGVYSANTHADLATSVTQLLTNADGSNPLAGKAVTKIVVNPNTPTMIWVAVSDFTINGTSGNASIWRHDGVNWQDVSPTFPHVNSEFMDLAYDAGLPAGRLYMSVGDSLGGFSDVYTCNNPTAAIPTWSAAAGFAGTIGVGAGEVGNIKIAVSQNNTAFAAVTDTFTQGILAIMRTVNGGATWTLVADVADTGEYLAPQGYYDSAIVASGTTVYIAGVDQGGGTNFVLRSTNNGAAWADISQVAGIGPHTDIHALAIDSNGHLVVGSDGGVWRYDPTGPGAWTNLNGDLSITTMTSVAVQPGNTGVLLGGAQDNGIFRTDGTTVQWDQTDVGDGGMVRFVPTQGNVAYHIVPFGGAALMKSTDGGQTWSGPIVTMPGGFYAPFVVDALNPNRVVVAGGVNGTSFNLQESLNQGTSFSTIVTPINGIGGLAIGQYQGAYLADPFFPAVTDVGANNYVPDTIYIANGNSLRVTKNHGVTWTGTTALTSNRTPPLLAGTSIENIEVDPSNSNTVYVVTSGPIATVGTGRVFKSIDAGLTWTDISAGLPMETEIGSVLIAWKITIDPRTNDLYLGTDKGVWKLAGGTGAWAQFGAGLPNVQVRDLQLDSATNILTIATYGRGAWQFYLDDNTLVNASTNPGALRSVSGNNSWTGPVYLAGPTTISANGSQALQNGLSAATLNIFGIITDTAPTNSNTLTKIGGGDVILSGASTYGGVTDIKEGNLVIRNPNALGGAALAGVQALSIQTTLAPVQNTPTLANGGGIPNGTTYFYEITAIGPAGESIASNEQTITTTVANQEVVLSWKPVGGATGYKVYRSTTTAPYVSPALLATITGSTTTTFIDVGAGILSPFTPPVLQFTLALNGFGVTAAIPYVGVAATDAAAIQSALTTAGIPVTSVVSTNTGMFLITLGSPLDGSTQPLLVPTVTLGFASASVTNGGGTIVQPGAALELESSLYLEPVTLNNDGIQPNYGGHNTGSLRSVSNNNTYTGTLTLNTNVTIGVDSGSSLNIANASAIVITSVGHGLVTGQQVTVSGVLGDSAANGTWTVTVLDANHFSLDGSIGNGNYTSGGSWTATSTGVITDVSDTGVTPILITSNGHGLASGQKVNIAGVLGNTAANGTNLTIAFVDANQFSITGTGNADYISGGTWTLVASGVITGATNALSITDNGVGHGLVKELTGTLIFSSAGSYGSATAGTTINQGILNVQNSQALGLAGTTTTVRDGAQLQLQAPGQIAGAASIHVANENLVLSGTGIANTGALLNVLGNNTFGSATSTITLTSVPGFSPTTTPLASVAFGVANLGDSLTIASPIGEPTTLTDAPTTGPLPASISKVGPGRLIFAQDNTYSGSTYIYEGALAIQKSGALGLNTGDDVQRITVFDTLGTDTFTLTFNGQTTGALTFNTVLPSGGAGPLSSVENALNALSSIAGVGGSVSVVGSTITVNTPTGTQTGNVYTVTFGGSLAQLPQPIITATPTGGIKIGVSRVADGGVGTLVYSGASLELDGDPLHNGSSINVPATQTLWLNGSGSNSTYFISDATQTGATVTLTTPSTVGLFTGENVTIAGFTPSGHNGLVVITVIDATHFSYTAAPGLPAVTAFGFAAPIPGALHNTSGNNVWQRTIVLGSDSSMGADLASQVTITGVVQDPAGSPLPNPIPPADLYKVGPGTVVFANANTYTGNTFVNGGVLNIQNNASLGVNTSAVQAVNVFGTSGTFQLSFNGQPTGNLPIGVPASGGVGPLASVQNALNALSSISTGGGSVTVVQFNNIYYVFFNGGPLAATTQPLLTATFGAGITFVDITALQLGAESSTVVASGATLALESAGSITESSGKRLILNGPGYNNKGALQNVAGNNVAGILPLALGSTSSIGADAGSNLSVNQQITDQHQVQTINLSTISNGSQYTLTFNGLESAPLTYNSAAGARAATALAIQNALNGLATINLLGGVVTVPTPGGSTYSVTFGGNMIGVNWPAIVLTRVSTGATFNAGTSMVSGAFGVTKVGPGALQYTGSTSNAYSGLTDVNAGTLQLNKTAPALAITRDVQIGDATLVGQVQQLDLSTFVYGQNFHLSYGIANTSALTFFTNPAYEASQIQAALNGLSTIGGLAIPGAVTVVPNGANKFLITFGGSLAGVLAFSPVIATNDTTFAVQSATLVTPGALPTIDSAKLLLQASDQIATSSDVTINDDGQFNLGGFAQTLGSSGSLTMVGGDVFLPVGSNLTIGSGGGGGNVTATSDLVGSALIRGLGTLTLGGSPSATPFTIGDGIQSSDLIISSILDDAGQGLTKLGAGRLEIAALEATTYTGTTRINAGDVQVDGQSSTQTITLVGAVAGVTKIALTHNGVSTAAFTYSGVVATDELAFKNAIVSLGIPGASVTVTANVADTIFTIVFTSILAPFMPAITSAVGTGNAFLALSNNIRAVTLNGGSISGTGAVSSIAMLNAGATGTVNAGYNGQTVKTGVLEVNGPVTWTANTTFFVDLANTSGTYPIPVAGADYDQLSVNGSIDLGDALLDGFTGAGIHVGDKFTIIQATGPITGSLSGVIGAVQGTIAQDGTVFIAGQKFTVHYFSNSVVLTRELAVFSSFTMTVDHNPSVYGQQVTYTVTAVPEPGSTLATANPIINFSLDGGAYSQAVSIATGTATFTPQAPFSPIWASLDGTITAVSGTGVAPIQITSAGHGLQNGDTVSIAGVGGNTNANGIFSVSVLGPDDFLLTSPMPAGNANYTSGGTWALVHTISAQFVDSNFVFQTANPTPNPIVQAVNKNTVTVGMASPTVSPTAPVFGQSVQVVATVAIVTPLTVTGSSLPTGTVTFIVDPVPLPGQTTLTFPNIAILNPANGIATLNLSGNLQLAAGQHTVTASYDGDPNYAGSAAPSSFTFTILPDASVVTITPTPASSFLGQNATFNISVAPALVTSNGQPIGTINLYDGSTSTPPLNAVPIVYGGGSVPFITSTLLVSPPAHNIIAVFTPTPGNNNYTGSQANISYTVNPASTATSVLSMFPVAPSYGQAVAFKVQVSEAPPIASSFGLPTGNVLLFDGPGGVNSSSPNYLGTGVLNTAIGQATITTVAFALSQGAHDIYAKYVGDGQFGTSDNSLAPFSIFVAAAPTTTTVTATPVGGTTYGANVTFKATVTSTLGNPPAGVTTGTSFVRFLDVTTGTPLGDVDLIVGGTASITVSNLSAGSHQIQATYFDTFDTNYASSIGNLNNYVINNAPTSVTVLTPTWAPVSPNPVYGQPVTLNARVTSVGGSVTFGVLNSKVTFWDGAVGTGINLGSGIVADSAGNASIVTSLLRAGTHTINASFLDTADTFFAPSNTAVVGFLANFVVNRAPTTVALGSSASSSALGQTVTYTATVNTVAPSNGAAVNAGVVQFYDNSVQIGTPAGVPVNASGIASTSITYNLATQLGTHVITAQYFAPTAAPINYLDSVTATLSPDQTVLKADSITVAALTTGNNWGLPLTYIGTVKATNPLPPGSGTPTGTVSVYEGVNLLATSPALVAGPIGTGTFTVIIPAGLSVGTHPLSFRYSGDIDFVPNTAPIVQQVVAQAVTTVGLTSSAVLVSSGVYQSTVGEAVTFTAVVTANSGGTPTTGAGTFANGVAGAKIVFRDNGALIAGTVTLTGTTATTATYEITTSALTLNTAPGHTISAAYGNGGNFANSSKTVIQKVAQATTVTTIASSGLTSTFGQPITFTAIVASSSGGLPDTGTGSYVNAVSGVPLTFYIGNSQYWPGFIRLAGTVTRAPSGPNQVTYSITTSLLPVNNLGAYQVQAYFLGNANFAATPTPQILNQPSAVLFQNVVPAVTITTLVSSPSGTSALNQAVSFTATVTAGSGGAPNSQGYARFKVDSDPIGVLGTLIGTTATSAIYRYTTSTLPVGPHTVQVSFVTDNPNFAFSDSNIVSHTVNQAQTATVLTSSPAVWAWDKPTLLTANVSYAAGYAGSLITLASVQFYLDSVPIGAPVITAAPFSTYVAFSMTYTLPIGTHTVTAEYHSLNPNIADSTASRTQTVRKYSNLTLTASAGSVAGTPVIFTATLTSLGGAPIANAAITFNIKGVNVVVNTNGSGVATTSAVFPSTGTFTVTATYVDLLAIFNDAFASVTGVIPGTRLV